MQCVADIEFATA